MSYRFKPTKPISDNVRRIAAEEIKSAVSHLRGKDPEHRAEDIHEARKSIKRLRALLRLVRPELGHFFRQENAALRDIGRSLSDLRDSSIVLETLEALSQDPVDRKKLQPIRIGLERWKSTADKTIDSEKTLNDTSESLTAVEKRIGQWPLQSDGFDVIASSLKAEYRAGRKAMPKAFKKNDSVLFHEWRKRAKCQLYHLRLLQNHLDEPLREREKQLHSLETVLGDDHNLLILRQRLNDLPGGKKSLHESIRLVTERENRLRTEARALGEKIYADRPKAFIAELRAQWDKAHPNEPPVAANDPQASIPQSSRASVA